MTKVADIPECLADRPRDRRGYPVPVSAAVDRAGMPHFTITDPVERRRLAREDRCHLSGRKLLRGRWFIGGPLAAFHTHGAFLDGPMLDEASLFAVRTCPYIAAPNYSKRIDDLTLRKSPDSGIVAVSMHEESIAERPELFVRAMCVGQKLVPSSEGDFLFYPKRPYRRVEFWRQGGLLDFRDGIRMAAETSRGELSEADILAACGMRE